MISINLYNRRSDPWAAYDEARIARRQAELAARRARRDRKVGSYRASAKALRDKKVDVIKAQKRDWYEANLDIARECSRKFKRSHRDQENTYRRMWIAAHPDAAREYRRRDYEKNSESYKIRVRRWRLENPERAHRAVIRYRERHNNAAGTATDEQIAARVDYYGGVCAYCGGLYEHLDHAIPLSRGGTNWPSNLRPACEHCNLTKSTKTPTEFAAYRALLTRDLTCGTV